MSTKDGARDENLLNAVRASGVSNAERMDAQHAVGFRDGYETARNHFAVEIERLRTLPDRGQFVQAMLRAGDSLGNTTARRHAEACADAALALLGRARAQEREQKP